MDAIINKIVALTVGAVLVGALLPVGIGAIGLSVHKHCARFNHRCQHHRLGCIYFNTITVL
jgi:ribosomal protein L11